MAAITSLSLSAKFCRDTEGNRVSCTGRVIEGTGTVVGSTVGNVLTFGGVSRERERKRQQQQQEEIQQRENMEQEQDIDME
jgi:hypothetical protein